MKCSIFMVLWSIPESMIVAMLWKWKGGALVSPRGGLIRTTEAQKHGRWNFKCWHVNQFSSPCPRWLQIDGYNEEIMRLSIITLPGHIAAVQSNSYGSHGVSNGRVHPGAIKDLLWPARVEVLWSLGGLVESFNGCTWALGSGNLYANSTVNYDGFGLIDIYCSFRRNTMHYNVTNYHRNGWIVYMM